MNEPSSGALATYLANLFESTKTPHLLGDASGVLTRRESKELVDRIAHAIHDRTSGLGRPASIALYLPRDNSYLASILAVWQSGHHYIPLNQAWPRGYTQQILADARPDLVIADSREFEESAPTLDVRDAVNYAAPSVSVLDRWRHTASEPGIAYVIYTSGSTGGQKGVVISRKALTAYIDWVARALRENHENQKLLINGEMSFDISLADLSFALAFETEIHISPDAKNMLAHARLLRDRGIDTFYGVPSTLSRLFAWASGRKSLTFDKLRTVFSGGDALTFGLIDLVGQVAPHARCYNMYGPTEVTMNCLYFPIPRSQDAWRREAAVPTGREFDHLRYAIVDPDTLAPSPGEGELLVSGDQCMDGYLHDPDRTAAAFVLIGGIRYYRTGDLFRRDPDGLYAIVGRVDSVVKVKGYRINTNTIDSVLLGETWVQEARTIAVQTEENEAQIVTFLSLSEPRVDYANTLSSKCRAVLPHYMVPSRFFCLDQLPHGKTGKVDAAALKALAIQSIAAQQAPV